LCGGVHNADETMIVSFEEIYMRDNFITLIDSLPLGCEAKRKDKNSEWVIRPK